MSLKKHLFICTKCSFEQECGSISSPELAVSFRKELKAMAKNHCSKDEVRVNASGCLGKCEQGISAVLYPQGKWFEGLRPGDEEKLLHHLINN